MTDWTLSQWAQLLDNDEKRKPSRYLIVLGMLFATILAATLWSVAFVSRLKCSSERLYKSMLGAVLMSPISFFDATPSGRIMNRFSKGMSR